MKKIPHWPDRRDLKISNVTFHHLIQLLTEPFGDEAKAKAFWQECDCSLILLEASDSQEQLANICTEASQQIEFAMTYPEQVDTLDGDYLMILAITSDTGGGVYLVIHPDCPILEGWSNG